MAELSPGTSLSHYRVISWIGVGTGEVYLAQDTKLDRKVALKILPAELANGLTPLFSRGSTTRDVVLISGFRN